MFFIFMSSIDHRYLVSDPIAFLPRLGELGFVLARSRYRELERVPDVKGEHELFRTELKLGAVAVVLEEYPFAHFLRIKGDKFSVGEISTKLGFSEKDAISETVEVLFALWRSERGLGESVNLRFDNYNL